MSAVPSIYHAGYRSTVHDYIRNLARKLDTSKILWFETTVEPQYMGHQSLDYSVHARRAYEKWQRELGGQGPGWPDSFPISQIFQANPIWNQFRAEELARWVNEDAMAFREVAGQEMYVAVDYLETDGEEMQKRNGDSLTFLRNLTAPDIIQVNWHWSLVTKSPNLKAYTNVRRVMSETGRPWAITEHMTLNGVDFTKPELVPAILENTLANGTRLGWEFTNLAPKSNDPFALYKDDWSPKPVMEVIESKWVWWKRRVGEVEGAKSGGTELPPLTGL